jgi:hypothetical protein
MNRIEELEKELKLLREIEELKNKPKFEVGKWYKLTRDYGILKKDMVFMYVRRQDDDNKYPFVIVNHQMFSEVSDGGKNYLAPNKDQLIEATNEEVQTALIKEAKKRGFKEGVRFELIKGRIGVINDTRIIDYEFRYIHQENELVIQMLGASYTIFKNGKWATIIDTPLTINGKTVTIGKEFVSIGCKTLEHKAFKQFVSDLTFFNITDFNHPEVGNVTTKQFQEIVDKIE